ncbi:Uu.00g035720.m01.CDS01 [Anthostomella pinea]|uniref:Uu.00g035720.m01.CDS01 n=1 Tax=Anthostomella pinea TaxID=933095 RepID=A0AAI8V9B2_9PEZI|nr:Uu.00g035720.m01.CDS01 [Anthostomella pinea]
MPSLRVGIVGAGGETGGSIVNGLLEAGDFDVVALVRPASASKPANTALKQRGVEIRPIDLSGSQDAMVDALKDLEVVISAVSAGEQLAQIPLATATKAAGVKRFLPCAFITVIPPGGVQGLRDEKEHVYNHIKQLSLPYTIVDVGWWYQISFPELPSGKIDYAIGFKGQTIAGDGNVPNAITDLRDIGRYVAKIIVDDRTLNKYVFVYNELWKPNDIYSLLEKLSGEKLERKYTSRETFEAQIKDADEKMANGATDFLTHVQKVTAQYLISWGIRGDNTPEYAKYLGYLTSKDLYPDFNFKDYEEYIKEVLDGKAKGVYAELRELQKQMSAAQK